MIFKHLFQRKARSARMDGAGDSGRAVTEPLYELWSRDTFEGRTFLCDVYDSYEEARSALDCCRASALTQDEELRDTYWLVPTDAGRVAERERMEEERLNACIREEQYNPEHLRSVCELAIDKFSAFLEANRAHPVLDRSVDTVWHHPDDCFNRIAFKLGRSDAHGMFFVTLWVWIRCSAHHEGGGIATFVLDEETIKGLCKQLRCPETRKELFDKARHLIREHYKDANL